MHRIFAQMTALFLHAHNSPSRKRPVSLFLPSREAPRHFEMFISKRRSTRRTTRQGVPLSARSLQMLANNPLRTKRGERSQTPVKVLYWSSTHGFADVKSACKPVTVHQRSKAKTAFANHGEAKTLRLGLRSCGFRKPRQT